MEFPPLCIHLWTIYSPSEADVCSFELILSGEERERAAQFHFPEDRRRFGYFHAVTRQHLASLLPGRPPPQSLRFGIGEFGKPFLTDHPGLHFNLSHSKDLAVLAATSAGPVGVDVEMLDPQFPAQEIAREYFVGPERAAIDRAPNDHERTLRFFLLWTAKEAVMKVTGLGMNLEPRSIELALNPATARPVGFHAVAGFPHAEREWKLHTQTVGGEAVLALAYPSGVTHVADQTARNEEKYRSTIGQDTHLE